MPVYGSAQVGGVLTTVIPGDFYTLFNGTETPASSLKSVAFERGPSPSGDDAGSTFQVVFPGTTVSTLQIQASNVDVDADYVMVFSSANTTIGNYTDTARWRYYRAVLTAYTSGGMPVVTVKR
jgi:hypothetical protein